MLSTLLRSCLVISILTPLIPFLLACRPDWDNHCKTDNDCCSGHCKNSKIWEYGVCQPLVKEWTGHCRPIWDNHCQSHDECCSGHCKNDKGWAYGVCHPSINRSKVISGLSKDCRPLWDNHCQADEDCCSGYCENYKEWEYGVCKSLKKPAITSTTRISTTETSHFKPEIFGRFSTYGNDGQSSSRWRRFPPTWSEFFGAVTANGFPSPRKDQYQNFVSGLAKGLINSKREAAMFLAQILHESGGLQFKEEEGCASSGCYYPDWDLQCDERFKGQSFHGRGYLQITYCSNYRDLSHRLGYGDELAVHPNRVADEEKLAWEMSFAFWAREAHWKDEVQRGQFGASTDAINGPVECRGQNTHKAQRRFELYTVVYQKFHLDGKPDSSGCYPI